MQFPSRPYTLYSTDQNFLLIARKPCFAQNSYLRINRLTYKMTLLQQQQFNQELSNSGTKIKQDIFMVAGIVIINEQPYLCAVKDASLSATLTLSKIYEVRDIEFIPFKNKKIYTAIDQSQNQKITNYLKDSIINENFYFSYHQDLTLTHNKLLSSQTTQRRYFWNQKMLMMFNHYKLPKCWKIPMIQGHVKQLYSENQYFSYHYVVISRRSKYMSGTRFNSRGIDLNCNTANFVQTEQIFECHHYLFSHVSVRGSAPIFWNQADMDAKISFKNSDDENITALLKHYQFLQKQYEGKITTINLLSGSKSNEKNLNNRLQFFFYKALPDQNYIHFDFNEETAETEDGQEVINQFIQTYQNIIAPLQNFIATDRHTSKIYTKQKIINRINCLDCIDRTNVVMSRLALHFLFQIEKFVNSHSEIKQKKIKFSQEYYQEILNIWVEIGNRISMIYCGTQSMAAHLTKQQNNSFFSFFSGGVKSLKRYYNASLNDPFKQYCIDILLGNKQQKSQTKYFEDNITKSYIDESKYCTYDQFTINFISWNCNILDPKRLSQADKQTLLKIDIDRTDMIVICLQQMVELNSFNVILGSNQTIIGQWRKMLEEYLESIAMTKNKAYIYLSSHDMVGIATFVFVSGQYYNRIYRHEWCEIKTGFNNRLGNKGAVVLFLTVDSTFVTIINCHLAAGQSSQNQRIESIQFIHNEALNDRNQRRYLQKSEFKFFVGDMNFRLQAKNEDVRQILYTIEKISHQQKLNKSNLEIQLRILLQKDEYYLNRQIGALSQYKQVPISFLPTYKYVKKQSIYDSKRTPSWCDRILYSTQNDQKLAALRYTDIDCCLSDHKPICGLFKILIKKQDADRKKKLIQRYMNE